MKNVLFLLCFLTISTFTYASNSVEREIPKKDKKEKGIDEGVKDTSKTEDCNQNVDFCRVTCGFWGSNGVYYEVSAGSIFNSCERAAEKCDDKLADL